MDKNIKEKIYENKNQSIKRPLLITFLGYIGILWLIMVLLGIIGIIGFIKQNKLSIAHLIIEIVIFASGIFALKLYFQMKRKSIYIFSAISGIDIIWNFSQGIWPLFLNCGCEFPLLVILSGLIYFKQMN